MTERRLVEEFGLQRTDENAQQPVDVLGLRIFLPFIGPFNEDDWEKEWQSRRILSVHKNPEDEDYLRYAYNSDHKAFVIYDASLAQDPEGTARRTEMRLWQMVQDSWVASGNSSDSLRFLMFSTIVNPVIQASLQAEWDHQLAQAKGQRAWGTRQTRILTVTPDNSGTWGQNPFIRSGSRLALSLSTAERTLTCEKAHLVERYGGVAVYLMLEFKNGDPGQENYREQLIRMADLMIAANLEQKEAARDAGLPWEGEVFPLN